MTLLSILLFELVEEPARRLVLRAAGLERHREGDPAPARPLRWAAAAAVAFVLALQGLGLVLAARPPLSLSDVRGAGLGESEVVEVEGSQIRRSADTWLVRLPRRWREGWRGDDRAPTALRVFADGRALPFSRKPSRGGEPAAFLPGPRSGSLALRLPETPATLVIVNETPVVKLRLALVRVRGAAGPLFAVGLALAVSFVLAARAPWPPRAAFAAALCGLAAFPLPPAILTAAAAGLAVLAFSPRRDRRTALEGTLPRGSSR
jgi:hypothetical protein